MALQEFIRESFTTHWEWLERYLDGLTQDEIEYRPNPQCHSIGFVIWHYGRALDMWTQTLARQEPQLYEREWAQRLALPPEPMDVGFGYGADELAAWRCPDKAQLLEYAAAARDNLLQGDAALTYADDGAGGMIDAAFTNIRDLDGGVPHSTPTVRFDGVPVAASGVFEAGFIGNRIQGGFYGPGQAEAAGIFEQADVVGAFGARRAAP